MEPAGIREPLRNVLVATDFSQAEVLERALLLRLAHEASITLLHVIPPDLPPPLDWTFRQSAERLLDERAASAESSLRAAGRHDTAVYKALGVGKPVAEILERAENVRAELVVIGRTGRSRGEEQELGATAERVTRASRMSVLIVAQPARAPYQAPFIAIDGGEPPQAIVDMALRIAGRDVRKAMLAHAFEVPDLDAVRYLDLLDSEIAEYTERFAGDARAHLRDVVATLDPGPIGYEPVVLAGDPRRVLVAEAERRGADLIAVGTHGRGAVLRLLLGSVAEAVLRNATMDVLVVR